MGDGPRWASAQTIEAVLEGARRTLEFFNARMAELHWDKNKIGDAPMLVALHLNEIEAIIEKFHDDPNFARLSEHLEHHIKGIREIVLREELNG